MPAERAKYPTVKKWRVRIFQTLGFAKADTFNCPITSAPCDNPSCVGGGFDLTSLRHRCLNTLNVKVELEYHPLGAVVCPKCGKQVEIEATQVVCPFCKETVL